MGKAPFIFGHAIKDGVRLLKEPDEYADTLYVLQKDEAVIIDPNTDTDNYYLVTVRNVSGYILKTDIIKK